MKITFLSPDMQFQETSNIYIYAGARQDLNPITGMPFYKNVDIFTSGLA